MEVNAEQGVVKYSKLIEDDATMDNEPSLILSQDATINHPSVKKTQRKIGFKTLVGLSLVLLMIVTGLVVGLFVMDMKIQRLNHQNLDLQARNQSLSYDLKNMKDALNISKVEIESLKKDIQGLMGQNQKLIKDLEVENQNCSEKQELNKTIMQDLKLQNQNLTNDIEKINTTLNLLEDSMPFTALGNDDVDKIAFFLDAGGNANLRESTFQNATILHRAAGGGHLNVVKWLIQYGADVNARDNLRETPLHYAAALGHAEVAEYLLQHGALVDANCKNASYCHFETPLHLAAECQSTETVEVLLNHGANVNATDLYQYTPLHYAARDGHAEIVELLLKHGARKDLKNALDRTPFEMAKFTKHGDYRKVLDLLKNN